MKPTKPPNTNRETPLEKMADLTRRLVGVRKEELPTPKKRKRRPRH